MMIQAISRPNFSLFLSKSSTGVHKLFLNNEFHSAFLELDEAMRAFNEAAELMV